MLVILKEQIEMKTENFLWDMDIERSCSLSCYTKRDACLYIYLFVFNYDFNWYCYTV